MYTHTTLLIVDDSTENLKLLGNSLKNAGFNILAALNGKQALALAAGKQPDLILLDVMMPEMNGFEVCEALKENDITRRIPVIFLTASIDIESIKNGFDAGGVDYIFKPFNPEELVLRVKNHLKQKTEKENLERELRFRSYVLKNISNGITTPLSELLQNSDVFSRNSFPEPLKTRLQQIHSSANAIMKFTSNLSDLVPTEETDNSKENTEVFVLNELLESLKAIPDALIKDRADESPLETHTVANSYTGNKKRLLQILIQLVSALSDPAKKSLIVITAGLKEKLETHDVILLEIFSAWEERVLWLSGNDPSSPHKISLLTARELLRSVNGKITSNPDASLNSDFSIEISLERYIKKNIPEEKKAEPFAGKNILVVEDSELNQRLIENVLYSYGANVTIAHNGKEALEKIPSTPYDVILMDVNVPLMNGIEVTKIIRTRYGIATPIIAISGHSDRASVKKCLDAGMNSFLLKPFEISDLFKIVSEELEKDQTDRIKEIPVKDNLSVFVKEADRYSLDKLNELGNGDQELIGNWMNHFKVLVKKGITEIDNILLTKRYISENKIFHELNNYTSYFGVELLREYLKDLPKIHKSRSKAELMDHFRLIAEELTSIDRFFKEEEDHKEGRIN